MLVVHFSTQELRCTGCRERTSWNSSAAPWIFCTVIMCLGGSFSGCRSNLTFILETSQHKLYFPRVSALLYHLLHVSTFLRSCFSSLALQLLQYTWLVMADVAPGLLSTRLISKGIKNYWQADMANTKFYYLILKHHLFSCKEYTRAK